MKARKFIMVLGTLWVATFLVVLAAHWFVAFMFYELLKEVR